MKQQPFSKQTILVVRWGMEHLTADYRETAELPIALEPNAETPLVLAPVGHYIADKDVG
jgi:hypothetical protein